MKKMIGLFLALVMIFACTVPAFAMTELPCETLTFNNSNTAQSDHFELTATDKLSYGWMVSPIVGALTVSATDSNVMISKIEVKFASPDTTYSWDRVPVSHGTRQAAYSEGEEFFAFITGIRASEFTLGNDSGAGGGGCFLTAVTVYYSDCSQGIHDYVDSVCAICGEPCPHAHTTVVCDDCDAAVSDNSASTLSEGNPAIVVGVAAAVIFGLGGFALGRRKKYASAYGAKNEDEA